MDDNGEDDDYNLNNLSFNEEMEDDENEEFDCGTQLVDDDFNCNRVEITPDNNQKPKIPIMKDGTATCIRCGNVGVKDTFYGKGKQYCSGNCVRGLPPQTSRQAPLFKMSTPGGTPSSSLSLTPANAAALRKVTADLTSTTGSNSLSKSTDKVSSAAISSASKATKTKSGNKSFQKPVKVNAPLKPPPSYTAKNSQPKHMANSFDWITLLQKDPNLKAASVSSFKFAPLADTWNSLVTIGLKVEVKNNDFSVPANAKVNQEFYWIASVVKIAGYFVLLRYEGFGNDNSQDFWINIYTTQVHPVGWSASQGKVLTPPKSVEDKYTDWKGFLVKRLTGSRTLPENFYEQMKESLKSRFQVGLKLEVVDKKRISAVRVARISKIVGGRLHITYEGAEEGDSGFWCHQESSLIHPVGWAQMIGHELRSTHEYAKKSSEKAITKSYEPDEAHWGLFPPPKPLPQLSNSDHKFKEGMKLEAIDPLNLSTICVATVTKVLRHNYLMIGIDGMMAMDGSDWFCYHASSPCIFPVGFCMLNKLELTPPRGYDKEFKWFQYLKECKAVAAPVPLFKKDIPNHGFIEGMYLEAVDLMEPRLVCVATITKVVGRLIKINFIGWDESYDQWCDCESPELFPIGWCQMVQYPLEPPRDDSGDVSSYNFNESYSKSGRKRSTYKGRYKRRKKFGQGSNGSMTDDKLITSNTHIHNSSTTTSLDSSYSIPSPPSRTSSNSSVVVKPSPIAPVTEVNKMHKLPEKPSDWTVSHVAQFLRVNDCGAYYEAFSNQKIDGKKLLQLTREDILELTGMKVGPSLKIYALVQSISCSK
ncbi:Polycomb protein Sfmbt-like protein [Dinothrombium tinctorium]|uniref:Polycomb protein Sfmbt-like protein n=1 Tax=Dinothrombium tinctorium TaxID=1965070 RepID=A0A443R195_9ACAR|nr:Polycomb protein Sfmbt-like protein [Dinothrombium tinctorium]RWS09051.1 Polycomb protein Sfmbt-like protein [Dinothrombium tinctorium]